MSDAGVQTAGSCFHLVYDEIVSWNIASVSCRRLGGVLATLNKNSTLWYLKQVFRFYRASQFSVIVGLKSTPDAFHAM